MIADKDRNKLILDHFGKLLTPSLAESMNKSAEIIRESNREYAEVVRARILYNQCAYGL